MTHQTRSFAATGLIYAGYLALRVMQWLHTPVARIVDDGAAIAAMAAQPLFSEGFLAGPRPFAVPLLYKTLQLTLPGPGAALLQIGAAAFAWGFLAWQISRSVRTRPLQPVALAIVLLFSLSKDLIVFDDTTLTESLSTTLMVLFVGLWFWLLRGWNRSKVVLLLATGLLWTFARDTNAWVVLCAGGLAIGGGLARKQQRLAVLGLALVLFFLGSNALANRSRRWEFPLLNVVGRRILTNLDSTLHFAERDMPLSQELLEMRGAWASDPRWAAGTGAQELTAFRSWLRERGKRTYISWLASRPLTTLGTPFVLFHTKINYRMFAAKSFSPLTPAALEALLYPRLTHTRAVLVLVGVLLVIALKMRLWDENPAWLLILAITALLYPHAFVVWHGDAMEIARHAHGFRVQYYLCAWLVLIFTFDAALTRARTSGGST